jgi:hypothetical protein
MSKDEEINSSAPANELIPGSGFALQVNPLEPLDLPDAIPEGGYGWICVLCVFTINAFTWGVVAVSSYHVPRYSRLR